MRLHFELGDGVGRGGNHLRGERLRVVRALVVVDALQNEVILCLIVAVGDEPPGAARRRVIERAVRRARNQ